MQRIFVGDVQGCGAEFRELLERVQAEFGGDYELWLVGDLVNRGPDNLALLASVRALVEQGRARYVLGNHEISLLRCWLGVRELSAFDSFGDVLASADADAWCDWLRTLPLVETGTLGGQELVMVHASVDPDWSLDAVRKAARSVEARLRAPRAELRAFLAGDAGRDEERLGRLTRCRGVWNGRWSSEEPAGRWRPWHEAWLERGHRYGVVYGHWSLQGLHVAPGLRGLDTGCVHHGRGRDGALTAWLPVPGAARPFDVPDAHFWSIPAHRAYYSHRDEAS